MARPAGNSGGTGTAPLPEQTPGPPCRHLRRHLRRVPRRHLRRVPRRHLRRIPRRVVAGAADRPPDPCPPVRRAASADPRQHRGSLLRDRPTRSAPDGSPTARQPGKRPALLGRHIPFPSPADRSAFPESNPAGRPGANRVRNLHPQPPETPTPRTASAGSAARRSWCPPPPPRLEPGLPQHPDTGRSSPRSRSGCRKSIWSGWMDAIFPGAALRSPDLRRTERHDGRSPHLGDPFQQVCQPVPGPLVRRVRRLADHPRDLRPGVEELDPALVRLVLGAGHRSGVAAGELQLGAGGSARPRDSRWTPPGG